MMIAISKHLLLEVTRHGKQRGSCAQSVPKYRGCYSLSVFYILNNRSELLEMTKARTPSRAWTDRVEGVTLIECVAAIAILGTAVVAGLQLFGLHASTAAATEAGSVAHRYLGREFERMLATEFDALSSSDFVPVAEDSNYETSWLMKSVSNERREMRIDIRWNTPHGTVASRSVNAFRCRKAQSK